MQSSLGLHVIVSLYESRTLLLINDKNKKFHNSRISRVLSFSSRELFMSRMSNSQLVENYFQIVYFQIQININYFPIFFTYYILHLKHNQAFNIVKFSLYKDFTNLTYVLNIFNFIINYNVLRACFKCLSSTLLY